MSKAPHPTPSFSPLRRWSIGLNVCLMVLVVLSVVLMVNYLSRDYFLRFHWSSRTKNSLSPLTLKFLNSMTNQVKVTLYYDRSDGLYSTVADLLKEYHLANPRITVQSVDYLRDVAAAQKVKDDYKLAASTDKNLIIFDAGGSVLPVPGDELAKYVVEQIPNEKDRVFRRKPMAFEGEKAFTATLLAVTNPKPLNAYFLQDHQEHPFEGADPKDGYYKFTATLRMGRIQPQPLSLLGSNVVPADCHLLIMAGPRTDLLEPEAEKIDQYLSQGGRLLVLLNAGSPVKDSFLGRLLAKWGVEVSPSIIKDPEHSVYGPSVDMVVRDFNHQHPIVNPLLGSGLYLIRPHAVGKRKAPTAAADAPTVEELAFSGPNASAFDDPTHPQRFPLMVAVEKGAIKGAVTERGSTRIVVVGDSVFLANTPIESADNRWFGWYAVNWLLARNQLLQGVGPRSVTEYRLVMSRSQMQSAQWLLLAGMPGSVLLLGGLIWLRRRR